MKTASIMLAGLAALTLGSVASAEQSMTGTVTRIDRLDGTIAIQLQRTPTQSGTVGAAISSAKTRVSQTVRQTVLPKNSRPRCRAIC